MGESFVTRFPEYKPSGNTVNGRRVAVGIDIDGCVDPGMYKHEPGFAVASLYHFKLQMITPMAMRAWMYVNCYSLDRGVSRFAALYKWADILRACPSVQAVGVHIPQFKFLRRWEKVSKSLSPEALSKYIQDGDLSAILEKGDAKDEAIQELSDIVQWSNRVNQLAKEASQNLAAFPNAAKVIRKMHDMGVDVCAVSGTPEDHVISHLREYGLLECFQAVFAQQAGKKHLSLMAIMSGKHELASDVPLLKQCKAQYDVCAMFGDAAKDYSESLRANKALTGSENGPVRMYLVEVGRENESWGYFYDNVLDNFVKDSWSREDEQRLIKSGLSNLDRVWDPQTMPIDTYPKRGQNG
jgi:phosphoglycolate phosphatase-like HAD superfamily hydrolase